MKGDTAPEFSPIWQAIEVADIDHRIYKRICLGSGPKDHCPPGWLRLDQNPAYEPDIVHDLNVFPWPIEDSSLNEVLLSHIVEHIDRSKQIAFWNELYRCSADKAIIRVFAPHWAHEDAWGDPTHVFQVTKRFFHYLSVPGRLLLGIEFYGTEFKMDFELAMFQNHVEPVPYEGLSDDARAWAVEHDINVVKEIRAGLVCHKPARKKEDLVKS